MPLYQHPENIASYIGEIDKLRNQVARLKDELQVEKGGRSLIEKEFYSLLNGLQVEEEVKERIRGVEERIGEIREDLKEMQEKKRGGEGVEEWREKELEEELKKCEGQKEESQSELDGLVVKRLGKVMCENRPISPNFHHQGEISEESMHDKRNFGSGKKKEVSLKVSTEFSISEIVLPQETDKSRFEYQPDCLKLDNSDRPNSLEKTLSDQFLLIPTYKGSQEISKNEIFSKMTCLAEDSINIKTFPSSISDKENHIIFKTKKNIKEKRKEKSRIVGTRGIETERSSSRMRHHPKASPEVGDSLRSYRHKKISRAQNCHSVMASRDKSIREDLTDTEKDSILPIMADPMSRLPAAREKLREIKKKIAAVAPNIEKTSPQQIEELLKESDKMRNLLTEEEIILIDRLMNQRQKTNQINNQSLSAILKESKPTNFILTYASNTEKSSDLRKQVQPKDAYDQLNTQYASLKVDSSLSFKQESKPETKTEEMITKINRLLN